jgi:hypothetical protein
LGARGRTSNRGNNYCAKKKNKEARERFPKGVAHRPGRKLITNAIGNDMDIAIPENCTSA